MQHSGFLDYKGYRYLKVAGLLAVVALLVYWATQPAGGAAYGGTGFGYASGIASALITLLLAWYGIRKRRTPRIPDRRDTDRRKLTNDAGADDASRRQKNRRDKRPEETWRYGGTLQGWLSAHVYLGTTLIVLTSLHSGWRVGLNIHTLAYVLLLLVVASGFYGAHAYLTFPRRISENSGEGSLGDLLLKIAELDELARLRALGLPEEISALVSLARQGTRLGGSFFQQLSGRQHDCPTTSAVQRMRERGKQLIEGDQPRQVRDLYAVLLKKQRLVEQARSEISLTARMQFWLYLHVPLSIALLAALFAHVAVIFIYW